MQKLKQTNKQKIPWKPRKAIELYDKEYKVELQYRLIERTETKQFCMALDYLSVLL